MTPDDETGKLTPLSPNGETVGQVCDAYLQAVVAGLNPDLEQFAARLSGDVERATFRVDALVSEWMYCVDFGRAPRLEDFRARLPSADEQSEFEQLLQSLALASSRAPWRLEQGASIAGRYLLQQRIGQGGMGVVWEALDTELDRRVALKAVRMDGESDATRAAESLRDESKSLARLKQRNIVSVYDLVRHNDQVCIVLDLIEGVDLSQLLHALRGAVEDGASQPRAWLEVLRRECGAKGRPGIFQQRNWYRAIAALIARLAAALSSAHSVGIVHRDLKPGNVRIGPDGEPVLLDFGLAHRVGGRRDNATAFHGTAEYIAPEQIKAQSSLTEPRSDVYALGLIAYELLAFQRAFPRAAGEAVGELFERIGAGRVTPLRTLDPGMPAALHAICERAMHPSLESRYPSMEELRLDLESFIAGRPPRFALLSRGARARMWAIRTVRQPLVIAGAVVAVLALVIVLRKEAPPVIADMRRQDSQFEMPRELSGADELAAGNQIGVRVLSEGGGVLYAVSVFGGEDPRLRFINPTTPAPADRNGPGLADDGWGRRFGAGESLLWCAVVKPDDTHEFEGVRVYASAREEPRIAAWLEDLKRKIDREFSTGVPYETALLLYAEMLGRGGDPEPWYVTKPPQAPAAPAWYERVFKVRPRDERK